MPGDAPDFGNGQPTASKAASDVFVSYASQDAAVADAVVAALERHGAKCWIAPRDMTPGAHYASEIVHAIDSASAIVLIFSPDAASSPHVLRELERATSHGHPVVTLRLDQAPLPAEFEYFLNTSQWLDASSGDTVHALPKLVSAVHVAIQASAVTSRSVPTAHASPLAVSARSPKRMVLVVASVVGLAFVGFAADRRWLSSHRATVTPATGLASAAPIPTTAASASRIPEKSVAVLPFLDMSKKKDQEYFSDGLSEELIDMLIKVPGLRVPARTSSFYFKGKQATIADIARALGVAHVLEGSVRKSGSTLRITAQLVQADNGYDVWSETYDRKLDDIFKIQDEIAGAVVTALRVHLLPAHAVVSHRTLNTEAYNELLLGRQFFNRATPDDRRRAVAAYSKAIALDPIYVEAYAGLAYAEAYVFDSSGDAAEMKRAEAAADKAVALAPEQADGYAARGFVRAVFSWDWAGAQSDFAKALALDPADSTVQRRFGSLHASLGRLPQAVVALRKATALDLLSNPAWEHLGRYLMYSWDFAGAHEALHRALEIQPESPYGLNDLGELLLLEGNAAESLVMFRKVADEEFRLPGIAMAEHTVGRAKESQRALGELIAKYAHVSAFQIAESYAWRSEKDKAFEWLDRAYQQRDGGLAEIKGDPLLASLRGDRRYTALLHKMNLPE
jgi:TolB-like protein/tetratricopeptide (TPR) repeat protein